MRVSTEPGWFRPALLALAAFCLMGVFSPEIADTDFWWHIKTGQYIVEHHKLPVPDPFSHTAALGQPAYPGEDRTREFNLTHEWLAQVIFYLVYRMAGAPGVVLLRALLLTMLCGLTGVLAARRAGSFYAGLMAAFAVVPVAIYFAADRPALVTFLCVPLFIFILELRQRLWLLPVLSLVWANCHGGFFLGWIVIGAYLAAAAAARDRDRRLWAAGLAAILISGLNPNHFRVIETLFLYRQSFLTSTLLEWRRPSLWGPPYAFNMLLYAAAAVLILNWRKVRMSDGLLFMAFAAAALMAFRNVMLIALLAPVLIAGYLPWRPKLPGFTGLAMAALLAVSLAWGSVRGSFFQLRTADWKLPSAAAEFILRNNVSAPLFNTYEHGGYLIWRLWPRQRVFIDGRALNESVYRDYRRILYNFGGRPFEMAGPRTELLARYQIGAIVMNTFEYVTGAVYPLAVALAHPAQQEWKLVYEDPQAMVFLREPPSATPVLPKSRLVAHLENECRTVIERDPELCLCARTLGNLFLSTGDRDRARRAFALYLAQPHPPDPEAERLYRGLVLSRR